VIVGLPEAPITGVILQNVKISARKGLAIGYPYVSGENLVVNTEEGQEITKLAGAKVSIR
jgi:hypothetical protein